MNYKILIYGKKLNGKQGLTGILEGFYSITELKTLNDNYKKQGFILSILKLN